MAFTLAIAGRPNVGKSTLFNRLTGRRSALVDDSPGVTRDRREADASLAGLQFRVVDTAGLLQAEPGTLEAAVQAQTDKALAHADAVLFLVDARAGILPEDRAIANRLRRSGKRIILAANKCEGRIALSGLGEAHALGLGEPIGLSAEHAIGLEELADTLAGLMGKPAGTEEDAPLPDAPEAAPDGESEDEEAPKDLRVAVVGRPNAGKSTLVNRLIGEERLVTSPIAGTTRDAIEIDWSYEGAPVKLFDTAGMRKRGKVAEKIEKLSVADALRAIRFAHVVVLLTDAETPLEKQDLAIADLAEREGRAVVIAVNKWDLVEDKQKRLAHLKRQADVLLPQLKGAPFVCLSAETGRGVELLMPAVFEAYRVWTQRVSTSELNRWLTAALERHPPPAISGRRIKLRYMTQVKARPPTFALFGNQLSALPDEYMRYLVNGLREHFGFPGTPMRMWRRGNDNPYADEK